MGARDESPKRARTRRHAWKVALAIVVLLVVAAAALVGYGLSERGLPFVVARIVAQTGGRISVEAPSGSVAGTMRFRRITWRGADATVTADDVVVDWNPGALWSRRLSIRGLGARHVDIEIKPSIGATQPPTDLRLPLAVDIERLAVARLDWRTGPRTGYMSGLEFGYAGDASLHRIRALRFVSDLGRLEADLQVGAREPLPVAGKATITGDGPLTGARVSGSLDGPLARIGVAAQGTWHEAALSLQMVATPFATAPIASAAAELTDVNAATLDPALPATRARVHLTAEPHGEGFEGALDIVNGDPGPVDTGRFPLAQMAARYVFESATLRLDAIAASLPDGGGVQGAGRIELGGAQRSAHFALTVADLDLARVHSSLVATRLSGRLTADADAGRQAIEGDVRDRDMTLAFAAVAANGRIDVTSFRAGTAAGALAGSARMMLDDTNAFSVRATMRALDPSRFAAVPPAALDGAIEASGALRPRWRAIADVALAPSSRIAGIAVSGNAKGSVAPGSVRDATVDLALGSARLRASGSAGAPGDRLAVSVDAPRAAELAALLPAAVQRPVAGEIHASGNVTIANGLIGGDVALRGNALRLGEYAAATLQGSASIAAPASASERLDDRAVALDVTLTRVRLGERTLDAVHAAASGSLARHHATLAIAAPDVDATMALDGSLRDVDQLRTASWSGTLAAFENRGSIPIRLRGPATLAARRDYLRLADAHVDVADGRADIGEVVFEDGRITTRGAFTGVALATAARLGAQALPIDTTLVLGGEWSIAATPRLTGRFTIRRERGDIVAEVPTATTPERQGLGVTTLAVAGTFADDALDATASFASARAGTATATLAIGAASDAAPGRIAANAPLRLAVHADLASLAVFQQWFGTDAAVQGRAQLDVAANGTLDHPLWSGTLRGDALRLDAPRYGVYVGDGRVRAHLAQTGIALDEVRLRGGDGTFTASGLIALPGAHGNAQTHVAWKAERFRATNRPDLRLVVSGEGALALADRRLALRGNVAIVEGHVEYEAAPTGRLAPDIVVEGETVAARREGALDVPLALDLDVDLGRSLTFVGEGIETELAGRVRITTNPDGALRGRGTIRAVNGTYFAFGQKLTIDRGRLIFDGPLDNPALDVVALRKNLPVEAGVALTGSVKVPQVRITSNPPVPENEALAWLVTGQGLGSGSRVDYAALSAASAALLGRKGKPFTAQIAQRFGLDDISVQSAGTSGASGAAGQVVVFGKRLSDRLSLGYEQGLSLASSALRLEYALSRRVTLRAEAGTVSGVAIVYRRSFR